MKISWRVDEPPTGRSFQKRGWPMAHYAGTQCPAAMIRCRDEYVPRDVKAGNYAPVTLYLAEWFNPAERGDRAAFEWRKVLNPYATLKDAKDAAFRLLKQRPEFWPEGVE